MTVAIRKRGGVRNPSAPRLNREKPLRQSPCILDSTPGAAAAYSLRRLSSAYAGPLVRVRRSADNAEQDIYANGLGNLDEKSLMDFAGKNFMANTTTWGTGWLVDYSTRVASSGITSPDGSDTTYKLIPTASTAQHGIFQTTGVGTMSPGAQVTVSAYVKAAELGYAFIWIDDASGHGYTVEVNLSIGAARLTRSDAVNYSGTSFACENAGNGWYRVSITSTLLTYTRVGVRVYAGNTEYKNGEGFGTPSFTGDGTSGIYIWGPQVESGKLSAYEPRPTYSAGSPSVFVTKWYDQSGALANKLINGHFETDTSGWSNGIGGGATGTLTRSTSISSSGIASLQIDVTGTQTVPGGGPYYQLIAALPGDTVTASANIRTTVLGKKLRIELVFRDASSNYITSLPGPDTELISIGTWYTATASVVAPANTAFVSLAIYAAPTSTVWTTGDRLYVDDVSLTRSGVYRDAIQATTTLQPKIVSNGLICRQGERPALLFNASELAAEPHRDLLDNGYVVHVVSDADDSITTGYHALICNRSTIGTTSYGITLYHQPGTQYLELWGGDGIAGDYWGVKVFPIVYTQAIFSVENIAGELRMHVNGVYLGKADAPCVAAPLPAPFRIGSTSMGSNGHTGTIAECIFIRDLMQNTVSALGRSFPYYGIQAG